MVMIESVGGDRLEEEAEEMGFVKDLKDAVGRKLAGEEILTTVPVYASVILVKSVSNILFSGSCSASMCKSGGFSRDCFRIGRLLSTGFDVFTEQLIASIAFAFLSQKHATE